MDASPISRWTLGQIASVLSTICNIPGADLACLHCVCAINVFKSHLDRLRWTQVLDRLRATRPAPQKLSLNQLKLYKRKSRSNLSDISTVNAINLNQIVSGQIFQYLNLKDEVKCHEEVHKYIENELKVKHWLESNVKLWTATDLKVSNSCQ